MNKKGKSYLSFSFLLPFTIMGLAFALHGVYPFGSKQILTYDLFQQHYPFLSGLWYKLREGGLSSWSWTAGGGHDYIALFAYFLASPLNFFAVLVPYAWFCEALTVTLLVKIGCAGLFAGMFFRYVFRKTGPELPLFAGLYALCAFTLGYYYSLNSFDSFALLPLVAMGLLTMLNESRYKLYIVSLALALIANFYYSFFVCIFIAIAFLNYCIIKKLNLREFLRKLGLTAACSALAIGMSAVLLLPVLISLQNVYSGGNFPSELALYHSFFDVLGNFIAFTPPTVLNGLPNLYSGLICVLFAGLYFFSKTISRREKIVVSTILVFLILCCNLNVLDYVIHGFRFTNYLPSRFSFLISFILVIIAYRGYLLMEIIEKRSFIVMGISGLVILSSAILSSQSLNAVIGSTVFCALYLLLLHSNSGVIIKKTRQFIRAALFLVLISELSVSTWIGVETVGTSERPDNIVYMEIQDFLNKRSQSDFYRTDMPFLNYNAPYLYNYNGISMYSNTLNAGLIEFMRGLGLNGSDVSDNILSANFFYHETSPLTGAFLSQRYMFHHRPYINESSLDYWDIIHEAGDFLLLRNKYYLPLGFMVKESLSTYNHDNKNPFVSQNNLFRLATGLKGDLFTLLDFNKETLNMDSYSGMERWNTEIQTDCINYGYFKYVKNEVFISAVNGSVVSSIKGYMPCIFPLGKYSQGSIISFVFNAIDETYTNKALFAAASFDSKLFEQGYSQLASQPLILTKFTDTEVCGTVTALEDGLLYTSIPADRNWSVYVDGEKSEIVLIDGAMAAVRLSKGIHNIEFRYFNKSLVAGIVISLVSLAVFAALVLFKKN